MLEKLMGALQMKMTATRGIQKFRRREKNKTLVKIWGGRDPCNLRRRRL